MKPFAMFACGLLFAASAAGRSWVDPGQDWAEKGKAAYLEHRYKDGGEVTKQYAARIPLYEQKKPCREEKRVAN